MGYYDHREQTLDTKCSQLWTCRTPRPYEALGLPQGRGPKFSLGGQGSTPRWPGFCPQRHSKSGELRRRSHLEGHSKPAEPDGRAGGLSALLAAPGGPRSTTILSHPPGLGGILPTNRNPFSETAMGRIESSRSSELEAEGLTFATEAGLG